MRSCYLLIRSPQGPKPPRNCRQAPTELDAPRSAPPPTYEVLIRSLHWKAIITLCPIRLSYFGE